MPCICFWGEEEALPPRTAGGWGAWGKGVRTAATVKANYLLNVAQSVTVSSITKNRLPNGPTQADPEAVFV